MYELNQTVYYYGPIASRQGDAAKVTHVYLDGRSFDIRFYDNDAFEWPPKPCTLRQIHVGDLRSHAVGVYPATKIHVHPRAVSDAEAAAILAVGVAAGVTRAIGALRKRRARSKVAIEDSE